MQCDRCDEEAVVHMGYAGKHLCGAHLSRSVEKRIRRRVREDGLIPDHARPEDPVTWVIGLSGGKDSAVLVSVLHETFAADPRVKLRALTIHEGIDGYRDESVAACTDLARKLDVEHELVAYEDEYGLRMDAVAADEDAEMAPCAYCGVFRRDILSRYAEDLEADLLLTGHNLDDEAQTALMNFLSGDLTQMGQHFEASLGPMPDRGGQSNAVPRAKPLRDVPEKEVALYAHVNDIPAHMHECPHATEAYRGEIQSLLHDLEERHPGTRHSIMSGYEELARMVADRQSTDSQKASRCAECGGMTTGERCRTCQLLDQLAAD